MTPVLRPSESRNMSGGLGREEISMRKLPGLVTVCAAVAVLGGVNAAFATPPSGQFSSTEYGRAQQLDNAKVVAPSGHDVESTTYTIAAGGDTGWRNGPGAPAPAAIRGVL